MMTTLINTIAMLRLLCASRFINCGVLILSLALVAAAQAPGSSRGLSSGEGNHSIQGRIYFPAGQAGSKVVKVNLESNGQIGGMSTMTDEDGVFRFNSLPPGSYAVVVDAGKQYAPARESVNIEVAGAPVTQVNIQLRPKLDASNPSLAGVPKDALDLYQKGTAAAQKGNPKSAAEFLSKAVTAYPNFPLALSDLGVQYLKLGDMGKAAETFEALLKLKPNDALANLDLGIALYNMGIELVSQQKLDDAQKKLDGAEAHLRAAIKLNSPGPSAHYYLGLTLIKFRAYDEAQKELELAISNGGENLAPAHKFLGGLYMSAHRNKEAADELEKYLKLDPKAKDADKIKGSIEQLRKQ